MNYVVFTSHGNSFYIRMIRTALIHCLARAYASLSTPVLVITYSEIAWFSNSLDISISLLYRYLCSRLKRLSRSLMCPCLAKCAIQKAKSKSTYSTYHLESVWEPYNCGFSRETEISHTGQSLLWCQSFVWNNSDCTEERNQDNWVGIFYWYYGFDRVDTKTGS